MRLYKSVRLASITSMWVDQLIAWKQRDLDKALNEEGLMDLAENYLLDKFPVLNGVSRNISLKISFSSIVELCYRVTESYTNEDWNNLSNRMKEYENSKIEVSNTPKLYLEDEIWAGLENYQRRFMGKDNVRILRLSFVIKLVIFAGLMWHEANVPEFSSYQFEE